MGKTMFGIPGVNEKSQTGGAIAPKGTPGGGTGTGNRGASGGMSQSRPQQRQSKPPEKAPMAKPAMAKPVPASGANMAQKPASPQKSVGSKTMFGMPAMSMPAKGGATASGSSAAVKPLAKKNAPAAEKAAVTTGKGDAYGATMLGAPAMTDEMARAAVEKEAAGKTATTGPGKGVSTQTMVQGAQAAPAQNTAQATAKTVVQPAVQSPGKTELQQAVEQPATAPSTLAVDTESSPQVEASPASPVATETTADEPAVYEDVTMTPVADAAASAPVISTPPPVDRSGEPSRGLVVGLIIGFFVMIGAMVFVASKLL